MRFTKTVLCIDPEPEARRVGEFIKAQVAVRYKRNGAVVGISGGIDSALVAALCVRALGADRVFGLILPEKESSLLSETYAREQADALGVKMERVDLTPILTHLGVYEKKDRVVRGLCPDYDPELDKTKISLPANLLDQATLNVFSLTVQKPNGASQAFRLGPDEFRAIFAAQNMKQRSRMMRLYYHAENMHYVVAGTTNRTELEQGFYVKYGDGGVDIEPIAHLYKTQVFQMARHVGVIEKILQRQPSPDTWSAWAGDEEFYFRMPFEVLDLLLHAWDNNVPRREIQDVLNLTDQQIGRAFRDFESKRRATWHLRCMPPSLLM